MAVWGPISRRDLIGGLRSLGFTGPYSGGKHQFMVRGEMALRGAKLQGIPVVNVENACASASTAFHQAAGRGIRAEAGEEQDPDLWIDLSEPSLLLFDELVRSEDHAAWM